MIDVINRAKSKNKWHTVILESTRPTEDEPRREELAKFRNIGSAHEWACSLRSRPEFTGPLPPFVNSRRIVIL